ncbi:MAG: sigma-70 family RNA polymerase sigma factor [Phycisphaeraceae bacterium]|nr:sigma-70 family RNA polymerase sigma factor [Phycisphaeraceae bacterium]MBX3406948.1 sigma-70 family RNA polymerase sigma factor [Phycisphaeraceae bacterium]
MASPDQTLANRTTTKLLDALRDHGNEPAWAQIDARYRPVIRGLARQLGLRENDAEEVAQQALSEFVRAYREGRYDRSKGRLSSWIMGIAHHTTLRMIRAGRRVNTPGATAMADVADEHTLRSIWTDERDRAILERALNIIRDESSVDDRTLRAFELVALRGVPAAEVAAQCGMNVDQVYVARSRVTKRLRSLVETLTAAFEEDD